MRSPQPARNSDPNLRLGLAATAQIDDPKVTTESKSRQPKQVYELEDTLLTPKPEATSTFEEYAAALTTFIEINDDDRGNPWSAKTAPRRNAPRWR